MSELDFESMGLKEELIRGIYSYGFEKPSTIQRRAIPEVMKGIDIIGQSQSGTGKTGTFVISVLQQIDETKDGCQAIILSSVRELAIQTKNVVEQLGNYMNIKPVLCIGGSNPHDARKALNSGTCIVIGTPGRVLEMLDKGWLNPDTLRIFVMDEADDLLAPSFQNQVRGIIEQIPESTQICLFSATFPNEVLDISHKFMQNPKMILVKQEELTLQGISQFYIDVGHDKYKFETFCDIYKMLSISQSIVYVNTREKAERLRRNLEDKSFTVDVIHSKMSSSDRSKIMTNFRQGVSRILISTDMLSRGIDIQQVSIVINYELPIRKESYLHRIGRSGRFGRKGVAINIISNKDSRKLRDLERYYSTQISPMPEDINDYLGS